MEIQALDQKAGICGREGERWKTLNSTKMNDWLSPRRNIEEALQFSEKKYLDLFMNAPDPIVILDTQGAVHSLNPAAEHACGFKSDEIEGKTISQISVLSPESLVKALIELSYITRGIQRPPIELEIIHKNGERRIFEANTRLVYFDIHQQGVQVIFRDVHGRKEAERVLQERSRMLDLANDAIVMWDLDNKVTFWNQAAEKIFGYAAADAQNQVMIKLLKSELPMPFEGLKNRVLAEKRWEGEVIHYHRSGQKVYVKSTWILQIDDKGKPRSILQIDDDITKNKLLEEQFFQSQKMEAIGRLSGGIAHDFNNLLTVIMGCSDLLAENVHLEDESRKEVDQIRKAAESAVMLTRQLLAFARKQNVEAKVIAVNQLIFQSKKMIQRLIGEDIELVTILPDDIRKVKIDPGQLEQVLYNLMVNARDAMPNGGRLIVETSNIVLDEKVVDRHPMMAVGSYVMIAVTDNGIGMPEEVRSRVFEPFFTTKEQGKGTGLGLATCYGIVKQANGHIWIYSELGRGTTIKIYLPVVEDSVLESEDKGKKLAPLHKGTETILLVEDESLVRNFTKRILEDYGYTVYETSDAPEALEILNPDLKIHLLVTDLVLPHMGGKKLAEKVREQCPGIRVLYTSGYTENGITRNAGMNHQFEFLQKPFSGGDLIRKVQDMLAP